MIFEMFFCNLDLTGGTWKNTTSYAMFVKSGIDVLVLVGGNSNMNQQNNDQKTSGVHILLPMWKLIMLEVKVGFLDVRLGSCYGIG